MSEFTFTKAERHRVPFRMALGGPAGAGKTYTALVIARALANSHKVAVLDTEHESASLYADLFQFDTLALTPPFTPERYRLGIRAAIEADYGVLVIDSLTHEWAGEGGVLEMVDIAKRSAKNQYTAWALPSAEHTKLTEAILQAPIHIIATMREKMQYVVESGEGKKTEVRKVGLQPIQREGMEFEFSVFAEMDMQNTITITKSRYKSLQGKVIPKPGEEFVGLLLDEIERGSEMSGGGNAPSTPASTGKAPGHEGQPPPDANVGPTPDQPAAAPATSSEAAGPTTCPKCQSPMLPGNEAMPGGRKDRMICTNQACKNVVVVK